MEKPSAALCPSLSVCSSTGVHAVTHAGTLPIPVCVLVCTIPGVPVGTLAGTKPIPVRVLVCTFPGVPVGTLAGTMPILVRVLVCTIPGVPVGTLVGTMPTSVCRPGAFHVHKVGAIVYVCTWTPPGLHTQLPQKVVYVKPYVLDI